MGRNAMLLQTVKLAWIIRQHLLDHLWRQILALAKLRDHIFLARRIAVRIIRAEHEKIVADDLGHPFRSSSGSQVTKTQPDLK